MSPLQSKIQLYMIYSNFLIINNSLGQACLWRKDTIRVLEFASHCCRCFFKDLLVNFRKTEGQHLWNISFSVMLQTFHVKCTSPRCSLGTRKTWLQVCISIKKTLQHSCFSVNIAKFLRTPIWKNIYERLLLSWLIFQRIYQKTRQIFCGKQNLYACQTFS